MMPVLINPEKTGIDQLAVNILKTDISKKLLPLIGLDGTPASTAMSAEQRELYRPIFEDRRVTAAAFYNLSSSFVKFLTAKVGIKKLQNFFKSADTKANILEVTGKNVDEWKADWLKSLT